MPQVYKTEISFGIHVGTAIEGSIGTYMKIDPLYLSPEVEIARRMNEMNDIYNTQVLFSGDFYELLSQNPQSRVRQIDQIIVKESPMNAIQIWSFDMKPIEPLAEDNVEDDEMMGVNEDKAPREIGEFIIHEQFNDKE